MKKEAFFECDACCEEAKDSSYVCTTCEFWIHKSCAFPPLIIPTPAYHHHPLTLVYSIPEIHRYFKRFCGICGKVVYKGYWLYYCHKCTYFVHMKCSTSTLSLVNEIEEDDIDNVPDLVQFPLPSQDSIFDLIVSQCGKFDDLEGENRTSTSTTPDDLKLIEKHWSHEVHPLQQLQCTLSKNDNGDNDDDERRVLICDGCIQPLTASQPSYYACIQCDFYLHSFCATKLPQKLAAGASPSHPNHSLLLRKADKFYTLVKCGVCCFETNGFYYECQTCDIEIDIRCAFLPTRIKHKSHKNHSLVQRPTSSEAFRCNATGFLFTDERKYACETCSLFQISVSSLFCPSRMEHRYDDHPITLRYPPFFYERVFYCEICEEQVDNQRLLYHCNESDHSFHYQCVSFFENIKLRGTMNVKIDDEPHTLTLVFKQPTRKRSTYSCSNCFHRWDCKKLLFECDGCGYLLCCSCVRKRFHFEPNRQGRRKLEYELSY